MHSFLKCAASLLAVLRAHVSLPSAPSPCLRPFLQQVLASVTISDPRIPVYSNVTGLPFKDAAHIREMLPRQVLPC